MASSTFDRLSSNRGKEIIDKAIGNQILLAPNTITLGSSSQSSEVSK